MIKRNIPRFNPSKKIFIIAEIGNNHEGNFNIAKKLIKAAADSGVDAVKFQTFITKDFVSSDHPSFERLKKFEFTHQQFLELKRFANKKNLNFISTPLDFKSANFLKRNCKIIKIASGDNNFYDLINIFLNYNKQLVISTGMMNNNTINDLIKFIKKKSGNKFLKKNLSLLHCISSYPAKDNSLNLMSIKYLSDKYQEINIGYSDHSVGGDACITAAALGAKIIEKHFVIDNKKTLDSQFSITPLMLKKLKNEISKDYKIVGNKKPYLLNEEKVRRKYRRSIYAIKEIKIGESFTENNIKSLRPKIGLCASNYFKILNKNSKSNYDKNSPIKTNEVN